jgi:hypothetical protein
MVLWLAGSSSAEDSWQGLCCGLLCAEPLPAQSLLLLLQTAAAATSSRQPPALHLTTPLGKLVSPPPGLPATCLCTIDLHGWLLQQLVLSPSASSSCSLLGLAGVAAAAVAAAAAERCWLCRTVDSMTSVAL